MKTPVDIAVTGAAGNISYSLLFRLATGELLGSNQPIILHLLEIPAAMNALQGVAMELNDCAYPLLHKIIMTSDPKVVFDNVDYVFLIGARPRGPGMERKDLLLCNAEIFAVHGKALNEVAHHNVKVLITGNPANTNALITMNNARDLRSSCFSAMTRLDHNRCVTQLAEKTGVTHGVIKNVTVWGNHSSTQYPDLHYAKVKGQDALTLVGYDWFVDKFIPTVQQRGSDIIKFRGQSSAASAANAALYHMKTWIFGSDETDWVSMAVPSDGSYGIEKGLIFSYPVTVSGGQVSIVQGLEINAFSRDKLKISEQELKAEKAVVKHLL